MKQVKKTLTILLLAQFFLSSCEKNEMNQLPKVNQIVYNGIKYDLSWGALMYEGIENGLHITSISLYSGSISYDDASGRNGTVHVFWFEDIVSSSKSILGIYQPFDWTQDIDWDNYNFEANPVEKAGLVMECELSTNRTYPTISMEDEGDEYEFNKGEIKIAKEGDDYVISFEGKDDRDMAISLYYKGRLLGGGVLTYYPFKEKCYLYRTLTKPIYFGGFL